MVAVTLVVKKRIQIGIPTPPHLVSKLNISKTTEPFFKNEGVLESGRKTLSPGAKKVKKNRSKKMMNLTPRSKTTHFRHSSMKAKKQHLWSQITLQQYICP